ncbi:MAG: MMPL family transporter, partial [Corynebacterium sp.]|nr:MMPL family transporter [Corynebacterium sp.]
IVVAGAFAFSDIVMMKYIAFGMIAALIIDATVIRMLLVPAVMFLLREDCWWAPRWVTALSRKIGHNEQLEGYSPEQATGPTSGPTSEPVREPVTVGAPEETQDEAQDAAPDARGAVVSRSPLPAARPAGVETQDATDAADAPDAEEHDEAASYGAHATSDDAVPFSELMRRLQQERPDDREN